MAGAGYKLFNTGDVLTAAQVNTYLMEQTVMVFADAAARTTALTGVVSEGMISYLKDTNAVEVYNGSAWVASDDPNAIQNTIVDAKGDLIAASAADTPARVAVGSDGDTLLADSSQTTGLRWGSNLGFTAGKNKIINGDFNIWQRGTSFTPAGSAGVNQYNADRFFSNRDGTGATVTTSRQTFTPGTAPVAGYEAQYFYRYAQTVAGTGGTYVTVLGQIIEGLGLAGQTVTLSFWAKADTARTVSVGYAQYFGTGGSSDVYSSTTNVNLTTSWARYSVTFAIASIAGKTIGTGKVGIEFYIGGTNNSTQTYDFWGVQVEVGSVATAFQTATGTLAGELAACQRYYWRTGGDAAYQYLEAGFANSTTTGWFPMRSPQTFRVAPTAVDYSTLAMYNGGSVLSVTNVTIQTAGKDVSNIAVTVSGATSGSSYYLITNNSTSGYLGLSAEL